MKTDRPAACSWRVSVASGWVCGLALASAPASAVVVQPTGGSLPANLPSADVFGRWGGNAAAIAVGSEWVLTNRHQDIGLVDRQVTIAGQTYDALASNQIVLDDNNDLRLVRLTDINTGAAAQLTEFAELSTVNAQGQTALIGGFGPTIGAALPDGFDYGGPLNNSNPLVFGQNQIDLTPNINSVIPVPGGTLELTGIETLRIDFDNPFFGGAVDFEAILGPGDSGGAFFVEQDGALRLAGLNHAITEGTADQADAFFGQQAFAIDLTSYAEQIERIVDQDFLSGDFNGDSIVAQADLDLVLLNFGETTRPEGWLAVDQITGSISQDELDRVLLNFGEVDLETLNRIAAVTGSLATVPEPSAALFLGVGAAMCAARRRRRA